MRAELIIIENDADHAEASEILHRLMVTPRPEDGPFARAQALLIQDWEQRRYPGVAIGPIDVLEFHIDQQELTPRQVARVFGSRARASEVLSGKRRLSLAMVRRIHREWGIPLADLLQEGPGEEPVAEPQKPAVPVEESVQPDYLISLEDGRKLKMLKRYLKTAYNMTPEEYRERWGLPADYPMVAPNYAKRRSRLAKSAGFGRKRARAAAE